METVEIATLNPSEGGTYNNSQYNNTSKGTPPLGTAYITSGVSLGTGCACSVINCNYLQLYLICLKLLTTILAYSLSSYIGSILIMTDKKGCTTSAEQPQTVSYLV